MSLKKHVQYDKSTGKIFGYIDKGLQYAQPSEEEATSALVLMAVGLKGYWKLPLGYFLVDGVFWDYLASVTKECIIMLYRKGIIVTSITCDGTQHNWTALGILGANLSISNGAPYFQHPSDVNLQISVFFRFSSYD